MTPLETLAKYGLDTSAKAIHQRMNNFDLYYQVGKKAFTDTQVGEQFGVVLLITKADQEVLCSLAEKGERNEELLNLYRKFFKETNIGIGLDDCDIDDVCVTYEYVDVENDKAEVETVRRIQELEAEGEGK